MNINELNRIKTVNIEEAVADAERGTGTFKEILENVMGGVIIPLVDNVGRIVGIHFDTKVENLIQDSIEQRKFEIRYCCKPVMNWCLKALQLKADGKVIAEVVETEDLIKVVCANGEEVVIYEREIPTSHSYAEPIQLPSSEEIPYAELEERSSDAVKAYLRNKYDHYLAGGYDGMTIEEDDDNEVVIVEGIKWGRKR